MKSDSQDKYYNITLALAGIYQASALVNHLANTGKIKNHHAFEASINSIFTIEAPQLISIYGSETNLKLGLDEIINVFSKKQPRSNPHISRYALSMMLVERQLSKREDLLTEIKRRIQHGNSQRRYFSEIHSVVLANLADTYTSTISTLRLRIQLVGKSEFLYKDETINNARALLLAGVRSAVLWHQVGGRRWQLFFARSKILQMATLIKEKSCR